MTTTMNHSRPALLSALLLALLAPACDGRSTAAPAWGSAAQADALTGDPTCTGPGVHERHVAAFRCDVCHPSGATFGFDTPFTFPGGTTTAGGTLVRVAGQVTTCTVACHSPGGAPAREVAWNTPGPLACTACHAVTDLPQGHAPVAANAPREDCLTCHLTAGHTDGTVAVTGHAASWSDPASPGFHAASANAGLASCQGCHGADLAGGAAGRSCASCHDANLPAGVTSWTRDCVMCHGGQDDPSGAPPRATWGNSADPVRTGAHAIHVSGGPLAPPADCTLCHQRPGDVFAAGHLDPGPAEVSFTGLAASGVTPVWDRATASCASTYCHGGRLSGGTNTAPDWTRTGQGEAACGTCHGLPPPAPHPAASGLGSCVTCHPDTMTAAGEVIAPSAGGRHLDGVIEALGGHGAGWMDTTSPGFHAYSANEGLSTCQSCHGAALDGVGGTATTSCATCHGPAWRTDCTGCHGGTADASGAPPRATWGNDADPLRTGAHERHLAGGASADPVACSACHVVPADALDAGHIGPGPADVTFSGVATAGNAVTSWNRTSGTCTTACHGGYAGDFTYWFWDAYYTVSYTGSGGVAAWDGGPATCGSCHGNPPGNFGWHLEPHYPDSSCSLCHPGVDATGAGFTSTARHVDGVVDVTPRWTSRCYVCH